MKKALTIAATALALAAPAYAEWEKFDALCGSSRERCQVKFDGEKMTMPGKTIFAEDVVSWNMSDNSVQKCSWGLYTGYYCHNNEDQRFFIKYMGDDGSRQLIQVAFINHKPARSFINMMSLWSGLEAENLRTTVQAEKRTAAVAPDSVKPFEDVTTSRNATAKNESHLGSGSTPAKRYVKQSKAEPKVCWSDHLKKNPALEVWANANPVPAAKLKAKHGDC